MADDPLLEWLLRLGAALDSAEIPFALAGGLARSVWAAPRATADIDLVIGAGSVDAVRDVARAAGLLQPKRNVVAFKRISLLRMVAAPPDVEPISIDFLLLPAAFERSVLERAQRVVMSANSTPVVSPEDLVILKLLRFSAQDLADIQALEGELKLDRAYLLRQAKALRLVTRLRRALPSR